MNAFRGGGYSHGDARRRLLGPHDAQANRHLFGFANRLPRCETAHEALRVLVMGAGDAGQFLSDMLEADPQRKRDVVAFLDDDMALWGSKIGKIPVFGGRESIAAAVRAFRADEIVIAIRHLDRASINAIVDDCRRVGCQVKYFGDLHEIDRKTPSIGELPLEKLLNRPEIHIDMEAVASSLRTKTVLVTGGAGSIGSELCRQMLTLGARRLAVFDIDENALFDLECELKHSFDPTRFSLSIGSIRDESRVEEVFTAVRPDIVFHAAAHKHVPLMEHNPKEAIRNNVIGTYNVARAAIRHDVEKFVLISTDKAVNPSSVMGATKRVAEMIVRYMDEASQTSFSAVRFGNVLGSQGSVVPLFVRQIERREPVTLTHREITRYFMTIPEAAQLVLESSRIANGSEVFILDMGEPVRIYDLACALIRMAGCVPGEDIPIEIVGLRPGEKMHEELASRFECLHATEHPRIFEVDAQQSCTVNVFAILEKMRSLLALDDDKAVAQAVLDYARSLTRLEFGLDAAAT